VDRGSREGAAKGIGILRQALELDPGHALAWAELSRAHMNEANGGWAPFAESYARAREAVKRALDLEPELAEGHARLGGIQKNYDWDWKGAEASYRRALDLAPGNAVVLDGAGVLAESLGRLDQAIALMRQSLERDPLSSATYSNLALVYYSTGRLVEAEEACRKTLELAPQRICIRAHLAQVLLDQGRGEEALAEAGQEPEQVFRLWALAIVHHAAGRRAESDGALQELVAKHAEDWAFQIAEVHAARGGTEEAFEWLERAYAQRDAGLAYLKPARPLRLLHGDPRWGAFLKKMGLEE
jgi:tetratricopeptide (TPR) repeat protein